MRVTSAGSVGIGTSSPAAKLDVVGPKDATNFIIGAPLNTVGGGALANYSELLFKNTSTYNKFIFKENNTQPLPVLYNKAIDLAIKGANKISEALGMGKLVAFDMGKTIDDMQDKFSGFIAGSLFNVEEVKAEGKKEEEDKQQILIDEIKGLRTDLNTGKIAVYMDGERVTSRVSKVVDRIGSNSYAVK
jgi:hypothetical protein